MLLNDTKNIYLQEQFFDLHIIEHSTVPPGTFTETTNILPFTCKKKKIYKKRRKEIIIIKKTAEGDANPFLIN